MISVSLTQFKNAIKNAKTAVKAEPIDIANYIQLKLTQKVLWVGARSASMSYNEAVAYHSNEDQLEFRTLYVPVSFADTLPKRTKNDLLWLEYDGNDLSFWTEDERGLVSVLEGMQLSAPFDKIETSEPYMVLRSGKFLQDAVKLALVVKKGWKASERPYSANFIRLAPYEEEFFREEEDDLQPDVCQLLLDDVTYDQARASTFLSSLAFSVFATDGSRIVQSFDPTVVAESHDFAHEMGVSTLAHAKWVGQALHVDISDLEQFVKVLDDVEYRIGVIDRKALVMWNKTSILWLRLALDDYPDHDFNHELALLKGDVVANFTPTKEFTNSISAIEKLASTRKNGLTVRLERGKVFVTSPENASLARYDELEAETFVDNLTRVVDGTAFLAALKTTDPLALVAGEDFIAIYNSTSRSRVILRNFSR